MKRFFLLLALGALLAPPVRAASADAGFLRCIIRCEAILRQFMASPDTAIPADVLRRARAIVIINQFQGGFILGVKDGYGVALAKKSDGRWSVPVFLKAGEISLGFQAGGNTVETVCIIMDEAGARLLFGQHFNFGVDAKAVAGPRAAEAERSSEILSASVLVYQEVRGLYAGATVKTGFLSPNDDANRSFYNTFYSLPEILYGNLVQPPAGAVPLMNLVSRITR